jgi:mRNA interferase RelE/StbE
LFEVIVSQRARKTSKRLPEHDKRQIIELLVVLQDNPVPAQSYDLKKLGGYRDTFRVRIGDVRVIYEVLWEHRVINVLWIKAREKAYS